MIHFSPCSFTPLRDVRVSHFGFIISPYIYLKGTLCTWSLLCRVSQWFCNYYTDTELIFILMLISISHSRAYHIKRLEERFYCFYAVHVLSISIKPQSIVVRWFILPCWRVYVSQSPFDTVGRFTPLINLHSVYGT